MSSSYIKSYTPASNSISYQTKSLDLVLFFAVIILCAVGSLMVFSTTAVLDANSGASLGFFNKHIMSVVIGLFLAVISFNINPSFYKKYYLHFVVFSFMVLLMVLILGKNAGGATRWIQLGSLRVQPGEFVKLVTVIAVAAYIDKFQAKLGNFIYGVIIPFSVLSIFAVLFLLQPDFGSTTVMFLVAGSQLFLSVGLSHFLSIGVIGVVAGGFLVAISPYRMRRFVAFLDPFSDPSSAGYQLIQSLIAVGSGGFFGEGLGVGRQKLFYLPASHTDFIFAVIAEEFGMIGALIVLFLFLIILVRGMKISLDLSQDIFLSSMAFGLTILIVLPALLNMAVVLGLVPTKGLVLPFISYGGTAMLVCCTSLGMLLRLSISEPESNED